jgi:Uma2 family endonuclease
MAIAERFLPPAYSIPSPRNEEAGSFMLRLEPELALSDADFFTLCRQNEPYRMERTARGDVLIMAPVSSEGSGRNNELSWQLTNWAKQDGTGIVYDSSCGYVLPNGAIRSPDASWVLRSRIAALPSTDRQRFFPLAPDFAAELMSSTDSLTAKMEEYLLNGVRLGILLQPSRRRVFLYRPGQEVEILESPTTVSGDPELPGLLLNVPNIFDAGF